VQWATEHLVSLGTVEVPRPGYLALLGRALELPDPFAAVR
jgi:leucyl/phenylalanyl-tRNA--protein transferase